MMKRTWKRTWKCPCLFVAVGLLLASAAQAQDQHMEKARRVLDAMPLFDGHNDLPWAIREDADAPHDVGAYDLRRTTSGHTDIARLRAGMVGAQFWSVYIPIPLCQCT